MRKQCAVLFVSALTAATPVLIASPVQGAVGDLVCEGNFQLNFSPQLTTEQMSSTAVGQATVVNCSSPAGSQLDLMSGNVESAGTVTSQGGSPCNLLLTINGPATIKWSTGQVTELDYTVNTDPANGAVTLSATATSGPLAGDTVTAAPVVAHPNAGCAVSGLSSLTSELASVQFG